jgi:aminoglycoside phosphotransferase
VRGTDSWEQVTTARPGADVRRSPDGCAYARSGTGAVRRELVAEHERLEWLADTDLLSAEVLDWVDDGEAATLTTRTVPGVAMSDLPATVVPDAVKSLGAFLQRLHGVRRETCPFERWLAVTVPIARVRVDEGRVDEGRFDHERQGRTAEELLVELVERRPRAEKLELADLVVCHGDARLHHFRVDPDSLDVTGMIGVHRLGVADRHLDLALAAGSIADTTLNPAYGPAAAEALLATYGLPADPWRLDFYRLLDALC